MPVCRLAASRLHWAAPTLCSAPLLRPPARSRLHPPGSELLLPRHSLPAEVRLCGKLELLDRILIKLRAGGHKVRCCIIESNCSSLSRLPARLPLHCNFHGAWQCCC